MGGRRHGESRPLALPERAAAALITSYIRICERLTRELVRQKLLRGHRYIVNLIEASASIIPGTSGYEVFILMEYCSGGGIIDMMNTRLQNRLTEQEILKIFSDVVEGVCWMHTRSPPLMHRDLKVENILLAGPGFYKLCDFGSTAVPKDAAAQTMHEIQELELELNKHTTLQYRAPEMCDVWSRKGVGLPADIWALGVLLYKLCFYTTPFEEHGPLAILNCQYKMPSYPNYSADIRNIISSILVESAQQRPTAWQVHKEVCRLRGVAPNRDYVSVPRTGHSLQVYKCNKADSLGLGMLHSKSRPRRRCSRRPPAAAASASPGVRRPLSPTSPYRGLARRDSPPSFRRAAHLSNRTSHPGTPSATASRPCGGGGLRRAVQTVSLRLGAVRRRRVCSHRQPGRWLRYSRVVSLRVCRSSNSLQLRLPLRLVPLCAASAIHSLAPPRPSLLGGPPLLAPKQRSRSSRARRRSRLPLCSKSSRRPVRL